MNNIVKLLSVALCLSLFACSDDLDRNITEPLPQKTLNKLSLTQAKQYDELTSGFSMLTPSEQAELLDVTYRDYFDFREQVSNNYETWQNDGLSQWEIDYKSSLNSIDEFEKKWRKWEKDNSLNSKVDVKIQKFDVSQDKSLQSWERKGFVDLDLDSHIGDIKYIGVQIGFDVPDNKLKRNQRKGEFYLSIRLGDGSYFEAPTGSHVNVKKQEIHKSIPDYLIGKSSEEILNQMNMMVNVLTVELTDGSKINSYDHRHEIPLDLRKIWGEMEDKEIDQKESLPDFYNTYAVRYAQMAEVEYEKPRVFVYNYVNDKIYEVNPKLRNLYHKISK